MPIAFRLQSYFRRAAKHLYDAVPIPPFTLFFHPSDPLPWLNYAIPDLPVSGDLSRPLAALRVAFASRKREPRFEFVEAFAPEVPASLRAAGFGEAARPHLMVLTPEALVVPPLPPGLTLEVLTPRSPLATARDFLAVQRRAFGTPGTGPVSEADASWLVTSLGEGRAFLARLGGTPVGTGMFTHPLDGLTEIAGVATLEPFRRRGIGAAVTHAAAALAFSRGAAMAVLSAADERSGRVYAGVGFRASGHLLVYGDGKAVDSKDDPP